MSLEQKAQILDRILSVKDYSPFILICDSLQQTADYLIQEIEKRRDGKREYVYISDLNSVENVAQTVQTNIKPGVALIGVFHTDKELQPVNTHTIYDPQRLALLEYMATSIIKVVPHIDAQQRLADNPKLGVFDFSQLLYNQKTFRVEIEHRRKSGRAFTGNFIIDTTKHITSFVSSTVTHEDVIPENLTTFNLTLNEKQRKDRENVELPFFEAQQTPDGGGAIVYQYEKDDDYDEEDPYEDPF